MQRVLKGEPAEAFGELSLPEKLAREKVDTPDDASGDGETTPNEDRIRHSQTQ